MGLIMKNGIQYPGNASSGGGSALPQNMSYCYCSFPRTDYSATVTGNFNTPIIFEEILLNNLICENGKVFLTKGKSYLISYTAQATLNGGQYLSVQNSDNSVLNQNGTNYSYSPVSGSIIYKSEKDSDYIYLSCSGSTSADNGTLKKHNLTFSVVELTEGVTSNGGGSYTLLPATSENLGGVIVGSGLNVEQSGKISVNVDAALSETSENPVQNKLITARMNEVFQSVSNGKALIASALTDKGFVISADATFAEFAQCIEDMSRNKTLVQSQTFSTADAAAAYVFSSSWFGSYARYDWKAFDGNDSTQWCCKSTSDMNGEYVGYDFQENIYPLTFEVYINNSNGSNPVFVFQGLNSNDEWVDLTEVTSLTTNGKVTITKNVDTAISYRKYRLYFLSGVQSTSKGADVYEVRIKGFKYA